VTEMNGLRNIIGNSITLHSLPEPPDPDDFSSRDEYAEAYNRWWLDTHCWTATHEEAP